MDLELINPIESVLHDVDQRSDEWFKLREGKITSSLYDGLMPSPRVIYSPPPSLPVGLPAVASQPVLAPSLFSAAAW